MSFPRAGAIVEIQSFKHDGSLHRVWDKTLILHSSPQSVIGGNYNTVVTEADGSRWETKDPAIAFFCSDHWFNVIALLQPDGTHYYCNLASPAVWDDKALSYIDYDLDIDVRPCGSYQLLDEEEYANHCKLMRYPRPIQAHINKGVRELEGWIEAKKGPFDKREIEKWSDQYKKYLNSKGEWL